MVGRAFHLIDRIGRRERKTPTLAVAGSGTVTMSGANTLTGTTTIGNGGLVNYQNGVAFGTNGAIAVSTGGTAQIQGNIAGGTKAITISARAP